MAEIQRALISVSNKTGVIELARELSERGVEIISTGGTAKHLSEAGIPVIWMADYTGVPEMLRGRVKTLHPKVAGGILGDPEIDAEDLENHCIPLIDYVVVNLYPFRETIARPDCTLSMAIENIDIGGPTILRAAAKNSFRVTVICDPVDYSRVISELRSMGRVSRALRRDLAVKAFNHTAAYDGLIADYLGSLKGDGRQETFGHTVHLSLVKVKDLRYGENPHQKAARYTFEGANLPIKFLHGKKESFNNCLDVDAALRLMNDFLNAPPTVAILKHLTPCAIGQAETQEQAWRRAYESDPESPFGGIVITNGTWTGGLAAAVHPIFTEVLIGPEFTGRAMEILTRKKDRRLVRWCTCLAPASWELRSTNAGVLAQECDLIVENVREGRVVTKLAPTEEEWTALQFAWVAVKHVKSNAVLYASATRTLAIGGGATSRVMATRSAVMNARVFKADLAGSVLASDAFFPMPDGVETAAKAGATAIVQPGGSRGDDKAIAAANQAGIAMVFTGTRHFRH